MHTRSPSSAKEKSTPGKPLVRHCWRCWTGERRTQHQCGSCPARAEFGFLILTGAETVGLVLATNAGDGSAQGRPRRASGHHRAGRLSRWPSRR